jgi:hypothetical protein
MHGVPLGLGFIQIRLERALATDGPQGPNVAAKRTSSIVHESTELGSAAWAAHPQRRRNELRYGVPLLGGPSRRHNRRSEGANESQHG